MKLGQQVNSKEIHRYKRGREKLTLTFSRFFLWCIL